MNRILFSTAAVLGALMPLVFDSALKGAALLAVAALCALVLYRASAATRHLVWLVAVVALLIVPVLSVALPQWRVLPKWAAAPVVEPAPAVAPQRTEWTQGTKWTGAPVNAAPAVPVEATMPPAEPAPAPAPAAAPLPTAYSALPAPPAPTWRDWLPLAWCVGFALLALRLLAAHLLLRRASRHCPALTAPPDEKIAAAFGEACQQLGVRQRVTLLLDTRRTIPVVWGVFRPRLMLPVEARGWTDDQLRSVLLHELAHIKRRDTLVQWLTQIACALHWWNPLVWLAAWRLHAERERACDDLVLASGVRPSAYAEHLLHVATKLSPARWTAACGLAMARKSSLEGRLLAVLSEKLNRRGVTSALAAIALILGAGIAIPVAMLRAADEKWNPPSGAHIGGNDFSAFCIHDGKDTSFVIAYHGDFNSSTTSGSNAKARTWTDAGTLTTLTAKKPGIALGFLRTHTAPGKLSITTAPAEGRDLSKPAPAPRDFGQKEYDLAKGRVFLLTDTGLVRQFDLPTPIVTDQEFKKKLAALIAAIPPQQREPIAAEPKHKDARALYESWQRLARANGDIPGALVGELAAAVKLFIQYNSTWENVSKLNAILTRLDAARDWKAADVIALLDEMGAIKDAPLDMASWKQRPLRKGEKLPEKFADAEWSGGKAGGLRVAWMLEPGAAEHRIGTALKARLLVWNTGAVPVMLQVPTWHQGGVTATDAKGAAVQVSGIEWTTLPFSQPACLGPGEFIEINAPGVGLGKDAGRGPWAGPRVGSNVFAKPGDDITLTHSPVPLDGSVEGIRDGVPPVVGAGWWMKHIKTRLSRELPLPAAAAERTHLLERAVRELFTVAPTAEEIAAFTADQTPGALDALAKRLAARPDAVEFAGKLSPAPVKFRVLAADPAAGKTPRVVLGPGGYPLSAGTAEYGAVTLKIVGRPVGARRTNDAQLLFEPTEFTGKQAPEPHKVEVPDGWGTWAIVCRPGEGHFYILRKGGARKIDYTKPRQVTDTPANDLPAEFRDEVKRQFEIAGVSAEKQAELFEKPAPPAATPVPKTAEVAGKTEGDIVKVPDNQSVKSDLPRADVKPASKQLFNEDYAAFAVQSEKDVNFVLCYQGSLSNGIAEWSSGAKWRFNGNVYLVDLAKTAIAGKNVNKRVIAVNYTSDDPTKLFLDGKAYNLAAQPRMTSMGALEDAPGRVFLLRDEGEPFQTTRTLPLRNEKDLATIGMFAVGDCFSAGLYAENRRVQEMEGWVLAFDFQVPERRSGGHRFARLRIFPDGRVLYSPNGRVLHGLKITAGEVSELLRWLAEDQKVPVVKAQPGVPKLTIEQEFDTWAGGVSFLQFRHNDQLHSMTVGSHLRKPGTGKEVANPGAAAFKPIGERLSELEKKAATAPAKAGADAGKPADRPAETGPRADDAPLQPKHESAQSLLKSWQRHARSDGKIPGGLVAALADIVDWTLWTDGWLTPQGPDQAARLAALRFTHTRAKKAGPQAAPYVAKLTAVRSRMDGPHDWTPAEAVAMLDELTAITTEPVHLANRPFELDESRKVSPGKPLPKELESAAWGAPAENGLRAAWLLEPAPAVAWATIMELHYPLGSVLKARVLFHNAGQSPVVFNTETWHQDDPHTARDAKGAEISVKATWFTGRTPMATFRLAPGEYCEVMGHGIAIGAGKYEEEYSTGTVGAVIEAKEGDTVTLSHNVDTAQGGWTRPGDPKDPAELWKATIAERVANEAPMPASAADREQLIRRVTLDILGVAPTAEEIAAFTADNAPDALAKLTARLQAKPRVEPFAGKLPTGETKFRVIAADPDAAKAPRTANRPGRYVLGDNVHLLVSQTTAGHDSKRTNKATIAFFGPDPKQPAPHKPHEIALPDDLASYAFAWERGAGKLWLVTKGIVRSYDFTNPAQVKETRYEPGSIINIPEHLREPLKAARTFLGAPVQQEKPKGAAAKLTPDALLGMWRGTVNEEKLMLSFHRPPVEEAVRLDIYEGEATIGMLSRFTIAEDGKSAVVALARADSATYGTLRPGDDGKLKLELHNRQQGQTEITLARDVEPPATEPRQAEARELFEMWKTTANADGTIPGTFIGALATEVRAYVKANPNLNSGMKLPKLLPRFVTSRDWTQAEAIKLLDDVAYYATEPISARVAKAKLPSGPMWRTMVEFQDIPVAIAKWSEAKDGLRIGMRVVGGQWSVGGSVRVELWLHNASGKDVSFGTVGPNRQDYEVSFTAIDAEGHEHWPERSALNLIAEPLDCTLPAGHVAMAKEFDVTFADADNDVRTTLGQRFRDLKPGKYQLRSVLMLAKPEPANSDKHIELKAPDFAFTLGGAAVEAGADAAPGAKPAAQLAKLPDDAYPKSGVPIGEFNAGAVNWSAEQNGLCLAMSVAEDAEWRIGGAVKVALWVCNPGEKDVKFQHCARRDIGLRVLMKGADGKERAADIPQFRGRPAAHPVLLPAGHIFKAQEFSVVFLPPGGKAAGAEPHFTLAAGGYKFRSELELPGLSGAGADGKQRTPAEGEWTGTLKSGEVDVKLVGADAPAAKPAQAKPAIERATVDIAQDGAISLDGEKVTLDELKARAAKNAKKWFTIRADKDVPYAKVIEVVEALKAAGVTEFSFSEARVGDGKYRVANRQNSYEFDGKHRFSICRPGDYPQYFTVSWPAEGERPACWLRTYPNVTGQTQGKWAVVWEPGTNVLWWVDDSDVGKMTLTDPARVIVDREGRKNNFSRDFGLPEEVKTEFRRLGFVVGRDKTPGLETAIGGNTGGQSIVSAEFGAWSIKGTVTDADGKPLADVPVRVRTNQELKTEKTDAKGEYHAYFTLPLQLLAHWRAVTVEPVLEGFTEREMAKAGEFNALLRTGEQPQRVRIAGDKDFQPGPIPRFAGNDLVPSQPGIVPSTPGRADFVMLKAGEITGEIVTADGRPAPPHFIAAATLEQRPGHSAAIELSDAQGHFRLKGIPTNKAIIFTVNPDGKPGETSKSSEQKFEQTGAHKLRIILPAEGSGKGPVKIERFGAGSE